MKKFQFAAGLLALATLGACSSDAPEVVGGGESKPGDDGMMFISLNIKGGEGTRAESETEAAVSAQYEDDVKSLSLVVYDETEKIILATETMEIDDNNMAVFPVSAIEFGTLKELQENNKSVRVVVIANSTDDYSADDVDVIHDVTADPTWGVTSRAGAANTVGEDNAPCFMMSNTEACHTLAAPNGKDGKTEANAWQIAADVKVGRMCTRFEYGTDNKDSYTPQHESGIKMTLAGFDIETHANSVYNVPMFTADGLVPGIAADGTGTASWTDKNHSHYVATDKLPYRMTTVMPATAVKQLGNYNYTYLANKTDKHYTYAHPNTVSTSFTLATGDNAKNNFRKLPFAAIRVKFECTNFSGTGKPSASMAAGDDVYAVGGIFIGGVLDYFMLKEEENPEFKVNYDKTAGLFSATEVKVIEDLEAKYNEILKLSAPSEKDASLEKGCELDQKWFRDFFLGKETYTKSSTSGNYYCYYSQLIVHDSKATTTQWKYGVSRNTSYVLAVESIKYMGVNGTKVPGEGPADANFEDLYIKLNIDVQKWQPNLQNAAWKL